MKWNLVEDSGIGTVVDTVYGTYEKANRKAREIEKERDCKIIIYQSVF